MTWLAPRRPHEHGAAEGVVAATAPNPRSHPGALWPEAKSAVVVGQTYAPGDDPLALLERKGEGLISAYAARRDYHDVLKGKLKTLAQWLAGETGADVKVFVDTAPLMEKPLLARESLMRCVSGLLLTTANFADVVRGLPTSGLKTKASAAAGEREAYYGADIGWLRTPVVSRRDLQEGARSGPLIVEEYDTTTVVRPGWQAVLDRWSNIVLTHAQAVDRA